MWGPVDSVEYPRDLALAEAFAAADVSAERLSAAEHRRWESAWREVFQFAFIKKSHRLKSGNKAVHEYSHHSVEEWLLVPFLSAVPGTPVHVHKLSLNAYLCRGPLLELGAFNDVEFFISPLDFAWTFVRTHEDFAYGGPYFLEATSL